MTESLYEPTVGDKWKAALIFLMVLCGFIASVWGFVHEQRIEKAFVDVLNDVPNAEASYEAIAKNQKFIWALLAVTFAWQVLSAIGSVYETLMGKPVLKPKRVQTALEHLDGEINQLRSHVDSLEKGLPQQVEDVVTKALPQLAGRMTSQGQANAENASEPDGQNPS